MNLVEVTCLCRLGGDVINTVHVHDITQQFNQYFGVTYLPRALRPTGFSNVILWTLDRSSHLGVVRLAFDRPFFAGDGSKIGSCQQPGNTGFVMMSASTC